MGSRRGNTGRLICFLRGITLSALSPGHPLRAAQLSLSLFSFYVKGDWAGSRASVERLSRGLGVLGAKADAPTSAQERDDTRRSPPGSSVRTCWVVESGGARVCLGERRSARAVSLRSERAQRELEVLRNVQRQ